MTELAAGPARAPRQGVLALELPGLAGFADFVAGPNEELVAVLSAAPEAFRGVWLSGAPGSGRSHLLGALCDRAQQAGLRAVYVACGAPRWWAALEHAADSGDVVVLDDVGRAFEAAPTDLEALLFAVYERVRAAGGELCVAHTEAAAQISVTMPDLRSRLLSLLHYHLAPLGDADKAALLTRRARRNGYALDEAVIAYWLARGPRDTGTLLADLARLEQASLEDQRLVTVPLLKQVLGY